MSVKCMNCNDFCDYDVVEKDFIYEENGIKVKYVGKEAMCKKCHKELFIDEIEDYNQQIFEQEYKKINEIITNEEIRQILKKYNIGKRALSLLLGFGEITITRYLDGYIPTPKNSKYLKKILKSEDDYYAVLLKNGHLISEAALKKTKEACEKLLKINNNDMMLIDVANYIINESDDITNLALQKLLYYSQVFSILFREEPLFSSECGAWNHGPVYGKIYYLFKNNSGDVINKNNVTNQLSEDVTEILDNVINCFGCYSGSVLAYFTHNEKPWKESRKNNIDYIPNELLKEFVKELKEEKKIRTWKHVETYARNFFEKFKSDKGIR